MNATGCNLSQEQKQKIAKEFNFSETVFLYLTSGNEDTRVDIFTPVNEMEFAGHPIIGAGHLLFRQLLTDTSGSSNNITVITKAGRVSISFDPASQVVFAEVPHNIHVHSREASLHHILPVQTSLRTASDLHGVPNAAPVVSVVNGVTYALMDLTNRADLFNNIVPGGSPSLQLDKGWSPSFTGVMYYRNNGIRLQGDTVIWDLRVRMIAIELEDPACGSGGCALGAYLALSHGQQRRNHRFNIDQGSEMGRDSHIIVDVFLDEERSLVSSIKLAGPSAFVAQGQIFVE